MYDVLYRKPNEYKINKRKKWLYVDVRDYIGVDIWLFTQTNDTASASYISLVDMGYRRYWWRKGL